MKPIFYSIVLLPVLLISCEKPITFKLDDSQPKLVVEATIENNQYPVVFLSKSLDYFSELSATILANSFVHGADVYISNGIVTQKLKENAQPLAAGYTLYSYTADSAGTGALFKGELNKQYTLRILWDGKEYTSTTKIPAITRKVDSLWWKPAPNNDDTNKVALMIKATDAPGYGDYIRYFTKRNREPFYPGLNSVYDDQVIDGTTYQIEVEGGVDRNVDHDDNATFFNKGDTVTVKLCNIDKATFDFWRTMEFSYSSIGNPFSSPTRVLGNISNGALGYFGGYGAQFRTLIIPR